MAERKTSTILKSGAVCVECGKPVYDYEEYEWAKASRYFGGKVNFIHTLL